MARVTAFSASTEFWDGAITREIVKEAVSGSKMNKQMNKNICSEMSKRQTSLETHCTTVHF